MYHPSSRAMSSTTERGHSFLGVVVVVVVIFVTVRFVVVVFGCTWRLAHPAAYPTAFPADPSFFRSSFHSAIVRVNVNADEPEFLPRFRVGYQPGAAMRRDIGLTILDFVENLVFRFNRNCG